MGRRRSIATDRSTSSWNPISYQHLCAPLSTSRRKTFTSTSGTWRESEAKEESSYKSEKENNGSAHYLAKIRSQRGEQQCNAMQCSMNIDEITLLSLKAFGHLELLNLCH